MGAVLVPARKELFNKYLEGNDKVKKKTLALLLLLSLSLIAMGCSASKTSSTAAATKSAKASSTSSNLFGQVESIAGSKLTIAIAEQSAQGKRPANNGTATSSKQSAKTANAGTTAPSAPNAASKPAPSLTLTGEKATIVVPDGISIVSSNRGNASEKSTKMALTDIKSGMTVQVTYTTGSDGQKTASAIRVMPTPGQQ